MRHGRFLTVALIVLLAGGVGPAQAGWQAFLASDGMSDVVAWDVADAPDGSVWFYLMSDGPCRFDGLTWVSYPGIDGGRCVMADSRGYVWNGRWRFDGREWVEMAASDKVKPANQTIEDSAGNIWIATDYGVARFDTLGQLSYPRGDGRSPDRHRCVAQGPDGDLWFGIDGGVRRYRDGVWTDITSADGHPLGTVHSLYRDRQGTLWFGTIPIMRLDGDTWTTCGTATTPPWAGTSPSGWGASPTGFAEDREGNLWISIPGAGVVRHREGVWKIYRDSDDPRITYLQGIAVDRYDNVWVATRVGALRFDGEDWDYLTPGSETTSNLVGAILEERPGVVWIGTQRGLYRLENGAFTIYTAANGLLDDLARELEWGPDGSLWVGGALGVSILKDGNWTTHTVPRKDSGQVWDIFRHSSGDMYVAGSAGLIRVRGSEWASVDTGPGPAAGSIYSVAEDDSGRLWVAASGYGVGHTEGQSWRWFTPADGLPSTFVYKVRQGVGHDMWVSGGDGGIGRFDGVRWTSYGTADGLADDSNFSLLTTRSGAVWAGSSERAAISRFDGTFWNVFGPMDGLQGSNSRTFMEDHAGHLWIGSEWGAAILDEDRVAPKTFFHPPPEAVSPSRRQVVPLHTAWGETKGILYSRSLDGGPWSDWSAETSWILSDLDDGTHELRARARDSWGNVESEPARVTIDIDATSPRPLIASPAYGQVVRDSVTIRGFAADTRFMSYRVDFRPAGRSAWSPLQESLLPVSDGVLAGWHTEGLSDGDYELRLEVADTLGLIGVALSRVIVDNEAPWADQTSPATVSAALGGDVFTTSGNVHLYFPPHAFAEAAVVTVTPLAAGDFPDTLTGGATRLDHGHAIAWNGAELRKRATLDVALGALPEPAGLHVALYVQPEGGAWERVGGTIDTDTRRLTAPIQVAGRYALFAEAEPAVGGAPLSDLALTPRVFSPAGSFASNAVAISFRLGEPGPVTVRVFNRAGRLVSTVASGHRFEAGYNLVQWTGTGHDGAAVPDGLYVVSVEAAGKREVQPLSVVR